MVKSLPSEVGSDLVSTTHWLCNLEQDIQSLCISVYSSVKWIDKSYHCFVLRSKYIYMCVCVCVCVKYSILRIEPNP